MADYWDRRWLLSKGDEQLDAPLRWRKQAHVLLDGDLFHENVPDEWIDRVFAVMALAPQHTFQILTKRAARMRQYMTDGQSAGRRISGITPTALIRWPPPNCWLGVSVEDQARADERIPELLATPAAVRFISAEPLLGPVDLTAHFLNPFGFVETPRWVIAGGESGPGARPWSIQWARELREQCAAASVPFFWKQNGEWAPAGAGPSGEPGRYAFGDYEGDRGMRESACEGRPRHFTIFGARSVMKRVGKKAAGRLLDGRAHSEFPDG